MVLTDPKISHIIETLASMATKGHQGPAWHAATDFFTIGEALLIRDRHTASCVDPDIFSWNNDQLPLRDLFGWIPQKDILHIQMDSNPPLPDVDEEGVLTGHEPWLEEWSKVSERLYTFLLGR